MRVSIVILVACALAGGVLGDKPKHKETFDKCRQEAGLGDNEMPKMHEAFKSGEEPDQKIKCFHACVSKEMGTMVDGKANKEKILSKVPDDIPDREKVVEAINKCSEEKGNDECDTAYRVIKCLHDNKAMPPPPHHHHHHHGPDDNNKN